MHSCPKYCSLKIAECGAFLCFFISLFLNHGTNRRYHIRSLRHPTQPPVFFPLPGVRQGYAVASAGGEQIPSRRTSIAGCKGSQLQWLCCQQPWCSPPGEQDTHAWQKTYRKMLHCLVGPKTDFKVLQDPVPMKVILWIFKILNTHKM